MNSKIIVPIAVVGALLFFGGKKKSPSKTVEEDIVDINEQEDYQEPEPEPKPTPKPTKKEDDKWKKLSASRRKIADLYLSDLPLETPPTNPWYGLDIGDYEQWSLLGNDSYADWLTNQIYWDITVNKEDTTDIYTMVGSTHPFYLRKGVKAETELENGNWVNFKEIFLDETSSEANKRLAPGKELWLQINSYVNKII